MLEAERLLIKEQDGEEANPITWIKPLTDKNKRIDILELTEV